MSGADVKSGGSSLSKALTVLKEVCCASEPIRFASIVERSELPKATAHRILNTLADEGLVRFEDNSQLYYPGYGLLELAHRAWSSLDIRDIAADQMRNIWEETEETLHLAVLDRGEVIYIDKLESQKSLRLFSAVGKKGPAYCTGVGKALLAYLPPEELAEAIRLQSFVKHTETTLHTEEMLRAELVKIREQGVSLDLEEHEKGIKCAASVIFNYRNEPIAALSITAPVFRVDDVRFELFQQRIKNACQEISKRMGAMASA